jgi:hypothetical protein
MVGSFDWEVISESSDGIDGRMDLAESVNDPRDNLDDTYGAR